MRKSKKLYPAEEWLIKNWLGDSFKLFGIEESIKITKEKINNYIYQHLLETNQNKPPFNPESFFHVRKIISKEEHNLSDKFIGLLQPVKGGFIVKINSKIPINRKRFTIAHEIGHTFFFDNNFEIPKKKFITANSPYWVEEDYVNSIASEILLPTPFLRDTLNQGKNNIPSLNSLSAIGNIYQVSNEVLSKKLIRSLKLWDCLYFQCNYMKILTPILSTIVKGNSFQSSKWTIPKTINQNVKSDFSFLYDSLNTVFNYDEKTSIYQLEIKNQAYEIQARQLYPKDKTFEILIKMKE
jgi:Zn-dependent peptidase ImmA (M78 family)